MGLFTKTKYVSSDTSAADEEKNAKAKARLLETQGSNNGAELSAEQGKSVRRIFG